MPCFPASDLLWVQITQSYPNRLRFSSLPCPQSPCHALISPVFQEGFFKGKNFFSHEVISRASRSPKMGDGGVFGTPCEDFSRPVEELEYTCLLKSTFTEASHDRGFKTWQTPATSPECLLWKNVSVGGGLRRMSHGPQHFESNNWQEKGCRSVCRITIHIACSE